MTILQKTILVLLAGLFWSCPSFGAVVMYLKVEGIPGESQDATHSNEIAVLNWSWGENNTAGGGGTPQFKNVTISKLVDYSSPLLARACVNASNLSSAVLTMRSEGANPVELLTLMLSNVVVTSVFSSGPTNDTLPETVTLSFAQLCALYRTASDGTTNYTAWFGWDVASNSFINPDKAFPAKDFGLALSYKNGDPVGRFTWKSDAGMVYQVWAADRVEGPYAPYRASLPSAGYTTMSMTIPATEVQRFFRLRTSITKQ